MHRPTWVGRLAKLKTILGTFVAHLPTDRRLGPDDLATPDQPVRSRTQDALLDAPEVVSSAHWRVVGTPADADEDILWPGTGPGSWTV